MSQINNNNKRIVKNTILLYFRMFLTIGIQLYMVPVVLQLLGTNDYGLYSVIGGITALFAFVGTSMASGAQRFFAYSIAKEDKGKLTALFNTTLTIYISLGIVTFILFEICGIWFIENKLQIPDGRLFAAHWVFQFSIVAFLITLIAIPYNAVVIAHERMGVYAYVSIGTSLLKLLSVLLLQCSNTDYLIVYAFFMMFVQFVERLFYQLYCRKLFVECRNWHWSFDRVIGLKLLTYSGFNMIGAFAMILRRQGLNIVMNLFFGTLLNAAHSIAMQVNSVIEHFISNLYMASRPQITKYYATNQIESMWTLVFRSSLMAYFLVMILGVIAVIEMPTVLTLWLHNVPQYSVNITRLFILCLLIETTTNQLIAVFQAQNRIKYYQIFSSAILLLNVPMAYFVLIGNSGNALIPYYIQLVFSCIYSLSLMVVSVKVSKLNIRNFIVSILCKEIIVTIIVFGVTYMVVKHLDASFLRICITTILTCIVAFISIWFIAIGKIERTSIKTIIYNKTKLLRI